MIVVDEPEATALGAALLGGIAGGVFPSSTRRLSALDRTEFVVEPDANCRETMTIARDGIRGTAC